MQNIRIDSHKLLFHPDRVAKWFNEETVYPISMEIALTGACNHRCIFCALDYHEYKPEYLDKHVLLENLSLLAAKGLKSVVYAGSGEPFLHKEAAEIIVKTKELNVDIGISTNGVLFTPKVAERCLSSITWIRFSVNAGTRETYADLHKTKREDFGKALENIRFAVEEKQKHQLPTTIGVQLLLLPQNKDELLLLGTRLKEIGVDYFTIKPYSQNPNSVNKLKNTVNYEDLLPLENKIKSLETEDYKVYFRANMMKKILKERTYNECYGLHFWTLMDEKGNIMPCILYLGNDSYSYGNIYDKDIIEIWEGKNEIVNKIMQKGTKNCREICRLDEINRYLTEIKNPGAHVNFI